MKTMLRAFLFLVFIFVVTGPVYAGGFGMYIRSGNAVDAEWDGDYASYDSDSEHRDIGFTLDSNLNSDRAFNYRLEIGRTEFKVKHFNNQSYTADIDGLVMSHNFGFGGMVTDNVRFWFGPELRMALLDGDVEGTATSEIDLFGYGFGGAAGINFNLPGRLTLSAKGGFVMMRYLGDGPNWDNTGLGAWRNSDYDVDEDMGYVSLSFYFRNRGR